MRHENPSLHDDSLLKWSDTVYKKKKNMLMHSPQNLYAEAVFSSDSLLLIDRRIDYQHCRAKVGLK